MSSRPRSYNRFFLKFAFAGALAAAIGYGVFRVLGKSGSPHASLRAVPSGSSFVKSAEGGSRRHHLNSSARVNRSEKNLSKTRRVSVPKVSSAIPRGKVRWIPGLRVREQRIINMMQKGKQLRMSELVRRFKNVTERTLRRDMDRLVRMGRVKKVGTTRATTYVKL